ncbi:CU044_2847 family protein [Streptomyces sp. 351MFTsu5.1]|uniref:CU044_2847 family protein n=1 Tax=Streptomyces sp. 351MFTsu5.1 TaxID=1172180 RepID=UPI0003A288E9|nr:CU044_2847 family protein [Streptomyces sp. 351MFTsu5.1]
MSFEIEPVQGFSEAASGSELVGRVGAAIGPALRAAGEVLRHARDAGPDEVEVKFGIKVTGTMNWLVAKAATEGNFEVTLSWQRGENEEAPQ